MNRKTTSPLSVFLSMLIVASTLNSREQGRSQFLKKEFVPLKIIAKHVRIQELLAQPKFAGKLTALACTELAKSTKLVHVQIGTAGLRFIWTDDYISYTFNVVQDSPEK